MNRATALIGSGHILVLIALRFRDSHSRLCHCEGCGVGTVSRSSQESAVRYGRRGAKLTRVRQCRVGHAGDGMDSERIGCVYTVRRGLKRALFAQEKKVETGLRRGFSGRSAVKNKSSASYYSVTHKMRHLPPHYLLRHLWLCVPKFVVSSILVSSTLLGPRMRRTRKIAAKGVLGKACPKVS
jgi:hypothetical protein